MPKIRRLGWRPDTPDPRDHLFFAQEHVELASLPKKIDNRDKVNQLCGGVFDQGDLGSCTAQAIAKLVEWCRGACKLDAFVPSRLFIYYNERSMEGTVYSDAGAEIRDGIKSLATKGVCCETLWPYDISKFTVAPSEQCYSEAQAHKAVKYKRLQQSVTQMKGCIAAGRTFVGGISVFDSMMSDETDRTGMVKLPATNENMLGGHALYFHSYDDELGCFGGLNSWGSSWGLTGHFWIPYEYLTNPDLAADFWTLTLST